MTVDPSLPPPPPRRIKWWPWILGGCGCLVLVAALIGGLGYGAFTSFMKVTAAPEKVVKDFLAAGARGDATAAHNFFSAPLKEEQPLEQFAALLASNQHLFKVTDTTFNKRSIDMSKATFEGTVTLESGTKMPASFTLVKENDAWKLLAYSIGESGTE
jgi:hypothetical protein